MSDRETLDLIKESEQLLSSVDSAEGLLQSIIDESGVDAAQFDRSVLGQSPSAEVETGADRAGYASFVLSEDEMSVTGYFYPPEGEAEPIALEEVERKLGSIGVVHGIDRDTIRDSVFRCNTERREVLDVVVARGDAAENAVPAHIGLRKKLLREAHAALKPKATDGSAGRVDHRAISPFLIVEKGSVLARDIPAVSGKEGTTVLGRSVPAGVDTRPALKPGHNVRKKGSYYLADVDGRFEWGKNFFRINEVLELKQEVDYHTGHIDFPGDVILHKPVRDGFRVHAGGSVLCLETLDASTVQCEGDLVARRGIIGRGTASVEVGGNVDTRYIENCTISAKGSVRSHSGIVNSVVSSFETIETGPEGIIIGGKLTALSGVRAYQIGSKLGTRTEIRCGVDFKAQNHMAWIQDRVTHIAFRLGEVRNQIARARKAGDDEGVSRLEETEQKLTAGMQKLQDAAMALLDKLDRDDSAVVTATGCMHASVYVEICHVAYQNDHPIHGVRLSLDKEAGKIRVERGSWASPRKS